jgi:glycosyltransferase involved in cell wall biosynthesis
MKRVAILTDFTGYDPGYSLCGVVVNQCKILKRLGYSPTLFVRREFDIEQAGHYGVNIQPLDPGQTGSNTVEIGPETEGEISNLYRQMAQHLPKFEVILSHDLIFQPNLFKYQVAARRLAKELTQLKWLHWVHSGTSMNITRRAGPYRGEISGKFPNSRIVAFHAEEVSRKASAYGYERDEVVITPNPIDFTEDYHPLAKEVISRARLWDLDAIIIYPCRLDRGKQPHIVIEIVDKLIEMGVRAKAVIVDFHSTGGDKAAYRETMRGPNVFFTSEIEPYAMPHKAVMDLIEFADVLVHPSMSETDSLVTLEAAWKRCGLVLNYDLPRFREFEAYATMGKFSSNVDVATGLAGETRTQYGSRGEYMKGLAGAVLYQLQNNPVLAMRIKVRKERNLEAVGRRLWAAIEA